MNLISLSGVYAPKRDMKESKVPVAIEKFLEQNPDIRRIILHLDNDIAGRKATQGLTLALPSKYEVVDNPPPKGKDYNDFLCIRMHINQNKFREERNGER